VSRTTYYAVFSKVCLRDNRVFLTYLAIYLLLYSYTAAPPYNALSFGGFLESSYLFALSDDAIMCTVTPGDDYFVLTLCQTQLVYELIV